jgi:hypothetical protein
MRLKQGAQISWLLKLFRLLKEQKIECVNVVEWIGREFRVEDQQLYINNLHSFSSFCCCRCERSKTHSVFSFPTQIPLSLAKVVLTFLFNHSICESDSDKVSTQLKVLEKPRRAVNLFASAPCPCKQSILLLLDLTLKSFSTHKLIGDVSPSITLFGSEIYSLILPPPHGYTRSPSLSLVNMTCAWLIGGQYVRQRFMVLSSEPGFHVNVHTTHVQQAVAAAPWWWMLSSWPIAIHTSDRKCMGP